MKKSQNSRNQGFSYYFCFMIIGNGSLPLTNGSGFKRPKNQFSGSMKFWGGSGSADPCLWLVDPAPDSDLDPSIFVIYLQHASKKLIFNTIFSAYYFLKVHLRVHHFSKIKSQKESQNIRNKGFSYYFCMMIEGSGSGSIPLTSGSGSGRPNMWIRWIRIRNTAWWGPASGSSAPCRHSASRTTAGLLKIFFYYISDNLLPKNIFQYNAHLASLNFLAINTTIILHLHEFGSWLWKINM